MRFTAFTFATLAATALASPIAQTYSEDASPVEDTPSTSSPAKDAPYGSTEDVEEALPTDLSSEDIDEVTSVIAQQPAATGAAAATDAASAEDLEEVDVGEEGDYKPVQSCEEVIALLEEHVEKMEGHTGSIDETLDKFDSGDISEEDANSELAEILEDLKADLVAIVTALTGAAGLDVADGQLDKVLGLLNTLLTLLLGAVERIVDSLGLGDILSAILKIVFGLLAKILGLLIGLLHGLLPGLLEILTGLLSGLTGGLLKPLLEPVLGLVTGLGGILN